MTRPKLEVIEGDASGLLFSCSEECRQAVVDLGDSEYDALVSAVSKAYANMLDKLFNMASVPYSSKHDSVALGVMAEDRVSIAVGSLALVCELRIMKEALSLHLISFADRSALAKFTIHEMRQAD